ncbi:hypothetical protein DAI22_06g148700 [Oryza sativa Japonica Group]|nr:hypothetical protein DAI22_06g148700 [Oryza sativa Japonica Group]
MGDSQIGIGKIRPGFSLIVKKSGPSAQNLTVNTYIVMMWGELWNKLCLWVPNIERKDIESFLTVSCMRHARDANKATASYYLRHACVTQLHARRSTSK